MQGLDGPTAVDMLRSVFRGLLVFRALYESDGVETIRSAQGIELCLWDVEKLYDWVPVLLPTRMAQSIDLFLVQNMTERKVATIMGIKPTSPVGPYATEGLRRLWVYIEDGDLPGLNGFLRPVAA